MKATHALLVSLLLAPLSAPAFASPIQDPSKPPPSDDPLLRDPTKKATKFDPSKVTYLTEWPKPKSKDKLKTDIERLVKAAIPEMEQGGRDGILDEGAAAIPMLLDRYGRERDEAAAARLKDVLITLTKAEHTHLLGKEFASRDLPHRVFAMWRSAAFPDTTNKAAAEAAWAAVVKQGDKVDPDERYAAALCATSTGSLVALEAIFEYETKSWAKKGAEMRVALESVRGAEATALVVPKLELERKQKLGALRMLAGCGDKSVTGKLRPLLDDTDNELRVLAINALRGIVDGDAPIEQLSAFEAIELAKKWKARL